LRRNQRNASNMKKKTCRGEEEGMQANELKITRPPGNYEQRYY